MKLFFKNILIFFSILFIVILTLDLVLSCIQDRFGNFKITTNPQHIIIGPSISACAYNDSLIPNFKNLSDLGESYFYSYVKLKKVLEQNPSIQTVFIEFSNSQISQKMDEWIWGRKKMMYRYYKYSSFMNISQKLILLKKNPLVYVNAFSQSLRYKLISIIFRDFDFSKNLGGYVRNDKVFSDSLLAINKPKIINHKSKSISKTNLEYLSKIIQYCEKYDKKVVLVRSPIKMKSTFNDELYLKILNDKFFQIDYLDFSNFPLDDFYFADFMHLNHKGAQVFSLWFSKSLKNGP